MLEPIENVIERCKYRIERSLDCNISDVIRLIEEVEKHQQKKSVITYHAWQGLGTGD
jgi:hypothetical protein